MSKTGTRAPDPRPARTKAAIYTAARELSAADGEVTVNALAKRAGVSRAAFYSHFGGLDDLMGDLIQQLIDENLEIGQRQARESQNVQHIVQVSAQVTAEYVAEHQAFLRGALNWQITHHTYLTLVGTFANLHQFIFDQLGDRVPAHLPRRETARFLAGGTLDVIIQWLLDAEQAAADGRELPARTLAERIAAVQPSWYTGLRPDERLPHFDTTS